VRGVVSAGTGGRPMLSSAAWTMATLGCRSRRRVTRRDPMSPKRRPGSMLGLRFTSAADRSDLVRQPRPCGDGVDFESSFW
jgi:hypothetical protein